MAQRQHAGRKQASKEEAQVNVPQLADAEVRRRAAAGYERAVSMTIAPSVRQMGADIERLRTAILADQRRLPPEADESTRNDRLMYSIETFMQQNPASPLTAYLQGLDDVSSFITNFGYTYRGRQVTLNLTLDSASALQSLRLPFDSFRDSLLAQVAQASRPVPAGQSSNFFAALFDTSRPPEVGRLQVDEPVARQFAQILMRELGIGPNQSVPRGHLPITVAFSPHIEAPDLNRPGATRTVIGPALSFSYAGPRPAGEIRV